MVHQQPEFDVIAWESNDGQWDSSNCTNSTVVLDFGQVAYEGGVYGTYYYNGDNFISDATILQAAEDYATGWYASTGSCPRLTELIGTKIQRVQAGV